MSARVVFRRGCIVRGVITRASIGARLISSDAEPVGVLQVPGHAFFEQGGGGGGLLAML